MFSTTARTRAALIAMPFALAGVLTACGGSSDNGASGDGGDANEVAVTLTDEGCEIDSTTLPAGETTFKVKNSGTSSVTEAEIKKGETIVAEKENIAPGLEAEFTVDLEEGEDYVLECPGGTGEDETELTVTAS